MQNSLLPLLMFNEIIVNIDILQFEQINYLQTRIHIYSLSRRKKIYKTNSLRYNCLEKRENIIVKRN